MKQILIYYALGLGSMALVLILTKIHYAMDDSITLATSISTTLTTILLIKDLNNKIKTMVIHNMEE